MLLKYIKFLIDQGVKRGMLKYRDLNDLHTLLNLLQLGISNDPK